MTDVKSYSFLQGLFTNNDKNFNEIIHFFSFSKGTKDVMLNKKYIKRHKTLHVCCWKVQTNRHCTQQQNK